MNDLILKSDGDLETLTVQHLIAVRFGKSTSSSYDLAVELARKAVAYREIGEGRRISHVAVFARSAEQASAAAALLRLAASWKSTMAFAGGRRLSGGAVYGAQRTLECFVEGAGTRDPSAHCKLPIPDLTGAIFGPMKITHVLPCKQLNGWAFTRPIEHCDPKDHIMAVAVKESCDWCPLFSVQGYEKRVEDQAKDPVRKLLSKLFG